MLCNFLVIGNGAREHAIIKSLLKKDVVVHCIGGRRNPGIARLLNTRFKIHDTMDFNWIKIYCEKYGIESVIVGPEKPLAHGIVDFLKDTVFCFGPNKFLSQIESSKAWARKFLNNDKELNSYSADYITIKSLKPEESNKILRDLDHYAIVNFKLKNIKKAKEFVKKYNNEVVVKLDGLEGGKGVKVWGVHFKTNKELMDCIENYVNEGKKFILEEKFVGKEFSLLSITDGDSFIHGSPIMDFKLLNNGDTGPNTGSMGSIMEHNNLNFLNDNDLKTSQLINENVVKKLESQGYGKYVGVLYGSFMKTYDGIKIIEFNCRFGDPEGVLFLNNIENSFSDIIDWVANNKLSDNLSNIEFKNTASMCKYVVSDCYPKKVSGQYFMDISEFIGDNLYYGSGMFVDKFSEEMMLHSSRGLLFLGEGDNIEGIELILNTIISNMAKKNNLCKLNWRTDFSDRYLEASEFFKKTGTYLDSGVDIDSVTDSLKTASGMIKTTHNKYVLSDLTSFGGMFSLDYIKDHNMKSPILVSSTDGVGTKTCLVEEYYGAEGYRILGQDIVNHCINDILVQGAFPLFFLDYFASSKFPKDVFKYFLEGVTLSCLKNGCALLGGETAEMPGVYKEGRCDVVGTIVGIVDKDNIINGKDITNGDIVLAIPSDSLHTNGFSMVRKIYNNKKLDIDFVGKLTKPHRCYKDEIETILNNNIKINGLCHITGGGLIDNPVRILPEHLEIEYHEDIGETMPEIYKTIKRDGNILQSEMLRIFNCGIGMLIIVPEISSQKVIDLISDAYILGEVKAK